MLGLSPTWIVLSPSQAGLSPTRIMLSPSQTSLSPSRIMLSPSQTDLSPTRPLIQKSSQNFYCKSSGCFVMLLVIQSARYYVCVPFQHFYIRIAIITGFP